jgi:hypothetical protein
MDYGGKFNSDFHGLGRYDHAAIAHGYGDLVEVFSEEATAGLDAEAADFLRSMAEVDNPLFGSVGEAIHYSELPAMFGGAERIGSRRFMPLAEYEAGDTGAVRVPYAACYDEYLDSSATCHVWDEGADPWEITNHFVSYHEDYYVFNNFARDRIGFWPGDVYSRVLGRYFLPITNMYQQWYFDRYYGFGNPHIDLYAEMAALHGFSHLYNVVATPRYGSYSRNGDRYEWLSYDPDRAGAALRIYPGEGKRAYSRYDYDSGYNLFNHIIEGGYFYEQLAALVALTSNDASALGVGADVTADFRTYSIPYYLEFSDELDGLLGHYITRDDEHFAPRVVGGRIVPTSFLFDAPQTDDGFVEIDSILTTRIYTMLYGMALLSSNWDLGFVEKGQIAVAGEGEPIDPGPGYEVFSVTNPATGRTYEAYYDPAKPDVYYGYQLLRQVKGWLDEYPTASAERRLYLDYYIADRIEDAEVLRSLHQTFQWAF